MSEIRRPIQPRRSEVHESMAIGVVSDEESGQPNEIEEVAYVE